MWPFKDRSNVCSINTTAVAGEALLVFKFRDGSQGGGGKLGSVPVREIRGIEVANRSTGDGIVTGELACELASGERRVLDTFRSIEDARRAQGQIEKVLATPARVIRINGWAAAVFAFLALVLIGLALEQSGSGAPGGMALAGVNEEVPVQQRMPKPDPTQVRTFISGQQPVDVQWADMNGVRALHQIRVGDAEPEFYVFSDPRCGACQMFERILDEARAQGRSFAIIPVATQGNGSAVLAAQSLCTSPDRRPAAWSSVIRGEQVEPESSDLAYLESCAQAALQNLEYFMVNKPGGRAATPTLMTSGGRTHVGALTSIDELTDWLGK